MKSKTLYSRHALHRNIDSCLMNLENMLTVYEICPHADIKERMDGQTGLRRQFLYFMGQHRAQFPLDHSYQIQRAHYFRWLYHYASVKEQYRICSKQT